MVVGVALGFAVVVVVVSGIVVVVVFNFGLAVVVVVVLVVVGFIVVVVVVLVVGGRAVVVVFGTAVVVVLVVLGLGVVLVVVVVVVVVVVILGLAVVEVVVDVVVLAIIVVEGIELTSLEACAFSVDNSNDSYLDVAALLDIKLVSPSLLRELSSFGSSSSNVSVSGTAWVLEDFSGVISSPVLPKMVGKIKLQESETSGVSNVVIVGGLFFCASI